MRQATARAPAMQPDVIVMDVQMPDGTGIEACRAIKAELPDTKVLMLTSFADDDAVMSSVLAGASAFLLKTTSAKTSPRRSKASRGANRSSTRRLRRVCLSRLRQRATAPEEKKPKLTENEQKIIERIAEGKTNREIAGEVYLSEKTVKKYVSNILDKLDLRRRSEAAAYIARQSMPKR